MEEGVIPYSVNSTDVIIKSCRGVLNPSKYTLFLAECLGDITYDYVLDLGCGSGMLSVCLALNGVANVVAIDRNEKCLKSTRINAKFNKVENKIRVIRGNMFQPFSERVFDCIVCNPPTYPKSDLTPSWSCGGGRDGRAFITEFLCNVSNYLKKNGELIFVTSSLFDLSYPIKLLKRNGYDFSVTTSNPTEIDCQYLEIINKTHMYKDSISYVNGIPCEKLHVIRAKR